MRQPGIEPGAQRWQRWILPLNHWHLIFSKIYIYIYPLLFSYSLSNIPLLRFNPFTFWGFAQHNPSATRRNLSCYAFFPFFFGSVTITINIMLRVFFVFWKCNNYHTVYSSNILSLSYYLMPLKIFMHSNALFILWFINIIL